MQKQTNRKIPDVSAREEKKVLKSVAKTGSYEMPAKRKQAISNTWEKNKPGTGFMNSTSPSSRRGTSNGYMTKRQGMSGADMKDIQSGNFGSVMKRKMK